MCHVGLLLNPPLARIITPNNISKWSKFITRYKCQSLSFYKFGIFKFNNLKFSVQKLFKPFAQCSKASITLLLDSSC